MLEMFLGVLVLACALAVSIGAPFIPAGHLIPLLGVRGMALIGLAGLFVAASGFFRILLKKAPASRRHEIRTRRLMSVMLATSILLGLGVPLFADVLNLVTLGGFPLGFYLSAQGALVTLTILAFVFVRRQNKIDAEENVFPSSGGVNERGPKMRS